MRLNHVTISCGAVVGRALYTSQGADGWRITSKVGDMPNQVAEDWTRFCERLKSADGPVASRSDQRERRLLWVGEPGDRWRYLIHSVAAGVDASNRPDNTFSDCLIVERAAVAATVSPGQLWASDSWLTPFGPQAVGAASLLGDRTTALALDVASDLTLERLVQTMPADQEAAARLLTLAEMVDHAGNPTGGTLWVGFRTLDWAPLLLDVLHELIPTDVAWDLSCEIRSAPGSVPGNEPLRLRFTELRWVPQGVRKVDADNPSSLTPAMDARLCAQCGRPITDWHDVIAMALRAIAASIQHRPEEASALASELGRYCADLHGQAITAQHWPDLLGAADQYPLLAAAVGPIVTHDHLQRQAPRWEAAALREELRDMPPSDLSYLLAASLGPAGAINEVELHRVAAPPPRVALDSLRRTYQALGAGLLNDTTSGAVRDLLEQMLRNVVVLACSHNEFAPPQVPVNPRVLMAALRYAPTGNWREPLRPGELLDSFLTCWLGRTASGFPSTAPLSGFLGSPVPDTRGTPNSMGWAILDAALPLDGDLRLAGQWAYSLDLCARMPRLASNQRRELAMLSDRLENHYDPLPADSSGALRA